MKVTVIIENKTHREELACQHGLSLLVETESGCILLDAGSSESAFANFRTMGRSPECIDVIVVSHNHFDHFGGMPPFLENTGAKVYISGEANRDCYAKTLFHKRELISRTDVIEKYRGRFSFVEDKTEILPGVFVCRIREPDEAFFCRDSRLKRMDGKRLRPDDFSHEIYMAVMEEGKCKLLSSCSHNGIVNILRDAERRFPEVPPVTFVGGLHMMGHGPDTLNCRESYAERVFSTVEASGLQTIYTGHCTGDRAFELLQEHKKIASHCFATGDTFVV